MSEAVDAPDCSITSGATGEAVSAGMNWRKRVRTPIRTSDHRIIADRTPMRATRNTKIRQLDSPILIGEDVGSLDIAMDNTLVVEID
jgi:hypothetical protein